jgi:tetratricopeptide (TPR) repeat protein
MSRTLPLVAFMIWAASSPLHAGEGVDAMRVFEKSRRAVNDRPDPGPESTAGERLTRARSLLDVGLVERALALLGPETDAVEGDLDGLGLRAEALTARSRPADAVALQDRLEERHQRSAGAAAALVDLLLLQQDRASALSIVKRRPKGDGLRLLTEGRVAHATRDLLRAETRYHEALATGHAPASALRGLANIAVRRNDIDAAEDFGRRVLEADATGGESLTTWAGILVRAGKGSEATKLYESIAEAHRWNGPAHYQLGNGYSERNYSELERQEPASYPRDDAFKQAMAEVSAEWKAGRQVRARKILLRLNDERPAACEPAAAIASLAWNEGEIDEAEAWCRESLRRQPNHGRAHATLAKAMESRVLAIDIHRARDEARLKRSRSPEVPGIATFVTNWNSLTERHRKRVALSMEPFAAFIPILVEGGQTFTIKLLHERLSEMPGHEDLKDERISYDQRLWDDVRGCGGTDTVTGIEDVERTIFGRYDTVLHELAHQVHGVLSTEDKNRIERAYTVARERESAGKPTFLSRYQGSSVWEYFAEGVNGLHAKKRDRWDDREIRDDRLRKLDRPLLEISRHFTGMDADDTARYLAPAIASRSWKDMRHAKLDEAQARLERASAVDPEEQTVLVARSYLAAWSGQAAESLAIAEAGLALHPASLDLAQAASQGIVHARNDRQAAREIIESIRDRVDPGRLQDLDAARAWLLFESGEFGAAAALFREVLAARENEPSALQGLLSALSFLEPPERPEAELRDVLERCVRKRAGSRSVRSSAAIALGRIGDFEGARAQIAEGLLNDPESDEVLAAASWVELRAGNPATALARAREAQEHSGGEAGWNDLAALVVAHAQLAVGDGEAAAATHARLRARSERPPEFVHLPRQSTYRSVHRFGPLERELLDALAGGAER